MGPAHCLSVSSSGKMCLEIPHTKRRGPPTKFSSWCSLIFPFSSRHQYHPGSFGGASVHVRSRGMAFHAATAASSVFLMGPLSAHPMYLHMTNAALMPFVLAIPTGCPHAGHGSNVSSSDMVPLLPPRPRVRLYYANNGVLHRDSCKMGFPRKDGEFCMG